MRFLDFRFVLALTTAAVVVWLAFGDFGRRSPGPLAASHFHAAKLRDDASCEECHGSGGKASMAQACSECHLAIGRQLESGDGFHGSMDSALAQDCGSCHPDHHGRDFSVVSALSFRLAGFETRDAFDHGMLDFLLEGAHESLSCADCHPHADSDWLRRDEQRFLGQVQDCASCHEDVHDGRMERGCEECHGQERPFEEAAAFAHHELFPLEGGHGRIACQDCHPKDSAFAFEELDGRTQPEEWRSCADCHAAPHADAFLAAASEAYEVSAGESCAECHPYSHTEFLTAGENFSQEQHAGLAGFPLEASHASLSCAECHAGEAIGGEWQENWPKRFPGRSARDCAACHADVHQAQFADSPHAQDGCVSCHSVHGFTPSAFDAVRHAELALPLDGKHAGLECAECHATEATAAGKMQRFRGTSSTCVSCHDDVHRDRLGQDCAQCHVSHGFTTTSLGLALADEFDHARYADFPLDGAHATSECASCHPQMADPGAAGRRLGFVADHIAQAEREGSAIACASCHADVHRGVFGTQGMGCASCHGTSEFGDLLAGGFSHATHAGFPLLGAHAQAECATCHGDGRALERFPDPHDGRLATPPAVRRLGHVGDRFTGDTATCSTCHVDVHGPFTGPAAKLGANRQVDCAACHGEASFRAAAGEFDHAGWTGHALVGAHADLSCVDCHSSTADPVRFAPGALLDPQLSASSQRRLGRARGRDCVDCHADPHIGQFRDSGGRVDCARCHTADGAFALSAFDHARDTRFPLDQDHAKLDCSACHQSTLVEGFGEVVRYRPLGRECASCHGSR